MHPNPHYRKTTEIRNIEYARSKSFGVLAINAQAGPLISHIPFQLSKDGKHLEAHLVRSNPILRLLEQDVSAVVAITGSDAYISPDWYGIEDQVPTWNYISVHLRGTLRRLPAEKLRPILDRISANMEARLLPKKPWKIDKMSPDALEKMTRQIVPIEMDISQIDGTWKLSQNKPESAIKGTISGLKETGFGTQVEDLIQAMQDENEI